MLCSAGVSAVFSLTMVCANAVALRLKIRRANNFFIKVLISIFKMWPPPTSDSGHLVELLNGTNPVRLPGAACLTRADVNRVASTVGRHDIGERGTVPLRIELHAVSNR